MKKENIRKESAITLIALVVTIVVLLILAGTSIAMLSGENGIIKQAQKSKEETIKGEEKEFVTLAYNTVLSNNITEPVTAEALQEELNKIAGNGKTSVTENASSGILNVLFKETLHSYSVNKGKIEYVGIQESVDYSYLFDFEPTTGTILGIKEEYIGHPENDDDFPTLSIYYYEYNANSNYFSDGLGWCVLKKTIDTLIIPSEINDVKVRAIRNIGALNVRRIIIEDGVEMLNNLYDFLSINEISHPNLMLEEVVIPSSLVMIGNRAFYGCTGLTSIKVDKKNPMYDSRDNCNAIIEKMSNTLIQGTKNTTIPSSVTNIGDLAFYSFTSLTSIEIPSSVTSIGSSAFEGCTGLTSIEIPSSVTSIGSSAFVGCTGVTSIIIPSSVTNIERYVFADCTGLTSVYFEHTTAPTFGSACFSKHSGAITTFYFRNSTVADSFTTSYYNATYGTKSTNYNW